VPPFKRDTGLADYPLGRSFEWEVIMKEFLIGAAGIVLAGAALAQTPVAQPTPAPQAAPTPPPGIDRVQTRDEVVAKVREHFAQLDTNRDGSLTKEEAEAGRAVMKDHFRQRLGERRREGFGRDGDPAVAFNRLDTNKDGSISRDEFATGREMRIERRVELKDGLTAVPGTPGESRRMRMHHMGGAMMGGRMFEMSDANKDGRVTLQEATDAAVRHFDMADANRDGRITPEERRTMHRQMIEKVRTPKAG
jgi:Ca2+-binding EF-hand superfamily protein